jgi:DnaK suppressor protein
MEGTMTDAELKRVEFILEAKQAELTGSLCHREDIAIEKSPDTLDEVQLTGDRELAIRNLDRDSRMLRLIHMALARIAGGSYGVCQHCEEDISPKRMQALPWAAFCIGCQERMDRSELAVSGAEKRFARAA